MAVSLASQRLLVTPGEPSGIGAEILVKAASQGATNLITFDDPDRLRSVAETLVFMSALKRLHKLKMLKHCLHKLWLYFLSNGVKRLC